MNKKCPKCNEVKRLDDYHYASHTKNNRQTYCKVCMSKIDKIKRDKYRSIGPTVIKTNKVCLKCNIDKPISEYPISRDKADGHVSYCKKCWTEYVKARRSKA